MATHYVAGAGSEVIDAMLEPNYNPTIDN